MHKNGTTLQKFKNEKRTLTIESHIKLNSISLDKQRLNMIENTQENLKVIYNPNNTTESKDVIWNSSNNSIAVVDSTGLVRAVSAGIATITADCDGKKAICEVVVSRKVILLESISIGNDISVEKGKQYQLKVTYNPSNTTENKDVIWESSDDDILSIDNSGLITAKEKGRGTIIARVNNCQAIINVTVTSNDMKIENNKKEDIGTEKDDKKYEENNYNKNENMSDRENQQKENNNTTNKEDASNLLDNEPKTGENNIFKFAIIILIISFVGFIICKKRMYK